VNCPHCGARNTETAPWCTQCLSPLRETPTPPASSASEPTADRPAPPPGTGSDATSTPGDRAFRSVDGQVQWRCPTCDTWQPLEVATCGVCGQPLRASVTGGRTTEVAERVGRARRWLWAAAVAGGVLMVVSVVLLVLAMRAGTAG
jgi:predicted amidophosphoribosyltransferase